MRPVPMLRIFMQLIRWKNLVLMGLTQCIFYFFVLYPAHPGKISEPTAFFTLLMATLCIAAGGYVINAIYDVSCDQINKPDKVCFPIPFSIATGMRIYVVLNSLGLVFALLFTLQVALPYGFMVFAAISFSLFLYSKILKRLPFIGNLLIAVLLAANLLILLMLPEVEEMRIELLYTFACFAFAINLIREMVKDLEDIKGDYNAGMRTLPILLGRDRSIKLILVLSAVIGYFFIRYLIDALRNQFYTQLYFTISILLPFFYFCYNLYSAKTSKQFHRLSNLLKVILIFGLLLVLFLCYKPF